MADDPALVASPWEETLQHSIRDLLALSFPDVEASIDWDHSCEFLDSELKAAVREANPNRPYVDKLVKVWNRGQAPGWILLYLVIQNRPDSELSARIFRHHSRLVTAFAEPVASLVILADEVPGWRPSIFEYDGWGYRVRFAFPIFKLLDLSAEELKASANSVAQMLVAQGTSKEKAWRAYQGR